MNGSARAADASQGEVSLVHHDFPLRSYKYAPRACYANAAARTGRFEPIAAAVFALQRAALSRDELQKVRALSQDRAIVSEVQVEVSCAKSAGIHETPTIVLTSRNGVYPTSGNID